VDHPVSEVDDLSPRDLGQSLALLIGDPTRGLADDLEETDDGELQLAILVEI